ncbi:MAG: anthranilate phosphoribosyltransferase [Planctomycetota bacterium]|jgi:anthranilate phosphoribosyltransferase
MHTAISQAMEFVFRGESVPRQETETAIAALMNGECEDIEIAALLTGLRVRAGGETVDEIAGAASIMRQCATKIPCQTKGLLDTCGTGGDGLHTFNISTATAIVAAACGVPVAKHGNRSVSSSSGSADVLESLGINLQLTPEQVGRCIDEVGIGFCFAPLLHSAMKHVVPVRRALGFRTIFNLLGPLTNPAGASFQLLGANRVVFAEKLATALAELGCDRALVVCGNDELDEVSLWGTTSVFRVTSGEVVCHHWTARDFDLPECDAAELRVSSAEESADVIQRVFGNTDGPHRNIVVANASAALVAAGQVDSPRDGVQVVSRALADGAAAATLRRLSEFTNSVD